MAVIAQSNNPVLDPVVDSEQNHTGRGRVLFGKARDLMARVAEVGRSLRDPDVRKEMARSVYKERWWIAANVGLGMAVKAATVGLVGASGVGAAVAGIGLGAVASNLFRHVKERTKETLSEDSSYQDETSRFKKIGTLSSVFMKHALDGQDIVAHVKSKTFRNRMLVSGIFGGLGFGITHGVEDSFFSSAHAAGSPPVDMAAAIDADLKSGALITPDCGTSTQIFCGDITGKINNLQADVVAVRGDVVGHMEQAHLIAREAREIGNAHPELAERAAAVVAHAKALANEAAKAVESANKMAEGGSLPVQKPAVAVVKMPEGVKAPETAVRASVHSSVRPSVRPVHHVAAKVSPVVPAVPEVDFTPVIRQKLVEMAGRLGQDIPVDASNADIAKMISADHPDAILNMMKSQAMQEHAAKVVEVPKVAKAAVPSSASAAPKVAAPVQQPIADKAAIPETTFKASEPVPTKYPDALKRALEQVHGKPLTDCETHITVDGQGKPTVNPVCQGGTPDAVINPGEHVRIDGQNIQLAETSRPTKLFNWLAERKIFTMMGCKKILGMSDISAEAGMMCAELVPQ